MNSLIFGKTMLSGAIFLVYLFGSNVFAEVLETSTGAPSSVIQVTTNEAVVVEATTPFAELSIANPNIADISTISDRTIYVLGKTPGRTTLTLLDTEGTLITNVNVHVTPDIEELKERLREVFPNEKIKVNTANDGIVLYGPVSSARNVARAMKLAQRYAPERVSNLMRTGEPVGVKLSVRLAEMHHNVRTTLNSSILESSYPDEIASTSQASTMAPSSDGNSDHNTDNSDLTAHALEPEISRLNASFDDVETLFHALEKKGVVRTLAEPKLETSPGQYVEFFAVGDFSMPIVNFSGEVEVKAKPLGIQLRIQPQIEKSGAFELETTLSVSSVNNVSPLNKKVFDRNDFQTSIVTKKVRLFEGQSVMITGLIDDKFKNLSNHKNILFEIPFIGAVFESPDYLNGQSELSIIITPSLTSLNEK